MQNFTVYPVGRRLECLTTNGDLTITSWDLTPTIGILQKKMVAIKVGVPMDPSFAFSIASILGNSSL